MKLISLSIGPFIICFLVSVILTGYLYLILHKSRSIFKGHMKIIFIILTVVMIRMLIPVNFPFTYSIYSYRLWQMIGEFFFVLGVGNLKMFDILVVLWIVGAIFQLVRYLSKRRKIRSDLEKLILTENEMENYDFCSLIQVSAIKNLRVALAKKNTMPAIFGVFRPIIILPEDFFMYDNLDFILKHEIQHYYNRDLLLKYIIDLLVAIYWWNPFVYYFRKQFNAVMEFSNDYILSQEMSEKERLKYAESLVKVGKNMLEDRNYGLSLAGNNYLENRIHMLLEGYHMPRRKRIIQSILHIMFSCLLMITTIFFVVEPSNRKEVDKHHEREGIFEITPDNAYFILKEDGYHLYVEKEYLGTLEKIDDTLKEIPIYEENNKVK